MGVNSSCCESNATIHCVKNEELTEMTMVTKKPKVEPEAVVKDPTPRVDGEC